MNDNSECLKILIQALEAIGKEFIRQQDKEKLQDRQIDFIVNQVKKLEEKVK